MNDKTTIKQLFKDIETSNQYLEMFGEELYLVVFYNKYEYRRFTNYKSFVAWVKDTFHCPWAKVLMSDMPVYMSMQDGQTYWTMYAEVVPLTGGLAEPFSIEFFINKH